jgi:hypothetical protein
MEKQNSKIRTLMLQRPLFFELLKKKLLYNLSKLCQKTETCQFIFHFAMNTAAFAHFLRHLLFLFVTLKLVSSFTPELTNYKTKLSR